MAWLSKQIRDNGPEFISTALADWAETHGIHLEFINPANPRIRLLSGFRTYRDEILNM